MNFFVDFIREICTNNGDFDSPYIVKSEENENEIDSGSLFVSFHHGCVYKHGYIFRQDGYSCNLDSTRG